MDNNVITKLRDQVNRFFVGKEAVVEDVLTCLIAGGHVLLEDVPGVGKTTLARTVARSMDCSFGRIQFTPDTLPTDVVGLFVYNMKTGEFDYKPGAVMHQMILADEINRTSPKTQACLLEAMAEEQVTVDDTVYKLPQPFMVIATQNPVEFLGTYPLPEASTDRFMMRLSIGYPEASFEIGMAKNYINGVTPDMAEPVCSAEDIINIRKEAALVHVSDNLLGYVREIIDSTRAESRFVMGASPRAMISLVAASRARAYLSGRDFTKPDDVKAVAVNVLHHRLTLTSASKLGGEDTDSILRSLILKAKIPME